MSEITAAVATPKEPDGAPRIAVLDILRGIAILGILFMNIDVMGRSLWQAFFDFKALGWGPADQVAWWAREVLANGTARCLLEMLFGAGMVILTERAAQGAAKWQVLRGYYWRNIILFLFGLVHVFILLWPGDILHTYGIAALVAFLFRRLRPHRLITIGMIMAVAQILLGGYFGYVRPIQEQAHVAAVEAKQASGSALTADDRKLLEKTAESRQEDVKQEAEDAAKVAAEDKARNGTFATWTQQQWDVFLDLQATGMELFGMWEAVSVMLIGAALFKLGILQGQRSRSFYLRLTIIAYAIGTVLRTWSGYEQVYVAGPHLGNATYEVARLAMTLGHVGLINLLVMTAGGARLLQPFVAAGRTALSIYIAQTIITLWILYPPFALGLYGEMTWWSLMATGLVINALLLWAANVYVRHYDIAPVEWAWRSLVERRVLPFHKRPRAVAVAPEAAALPAE